MHKTNKLIIFALAVLICGSIYYMSDYMPDYRPESMTGMPDVGTTDAELQNGKNDTASQESQPELIYVYVCGSVNEPGVYEVMEGSRVHELIALAGGFAEGAYTLSVSMAKTVTDGQTLYVPHLDEAEDDVAGSRLSGSVTGDDDIYGQKTKININTASVEQLMTLKGIGESRARDIVDYRTRNGSFKKTEDVMKVSGIKEAAYSKIKDDICVK